MITLNGKEVNFGKFPNGETNLPVGNLTLLADNEVKLTYEDDSDFMRLALVKAWIDDMNCAASLYLAYMPHSRMDRANGHYAVGLKAACQLVNSLNFQEVIVREPHSPSTVNWLNSAKVDNWCADRLVRVVEDGGFDSVFFPDFGAKQRYGEGHELPTSYGKKTRDFLTGEITGLELIGDVGANVLIVDDLCSRGGTFVAGGKLLKEKGAGRVSLLVAYVEDNVFAGEIFDHVDRIYTSSERELRNHPRITKID